MKEEWRDIVNYEGCYQVSNLGQVKSLKREIIRSDGQKRMLNSKTLSQSIDAYGYKYVNLSKGNVAKTRKVHRLVAKAFLSNILNKPEVNHIDGDKANNCVGNLEWATSKENMNHAFNNKLIDMSKKRSKRAKLTWDQVCFIRKSDLQQKVLAEKFKVDPKSIRQILSHKTYKHDV